MASFPLIQEKGTLLRLKRGRGAFTPDEFILESAYEPSKRLRQDELVRQMSALGVAPAPAGAAGDQVNAFGVQRRKRFRKIATLTSAELQGKSALDLLDWLCSTPDEGTRRPLASAATPTHPRPNPPRLNPPHTHAANLVQPMRLAASRRAQTARYRLLTQNRTARSCARSETSRSSVQASEVPNGPCAAVPPEGEEDPLQEYFHVVDVEQLPAWAAPHVDHVGQAGAQAAGQEAAMRGQGGVGPAASAAAWLPAGDAAEAGPSGVSGGLRTYMSLVEQFLAHQEEPGPSVMGGSPLSVTTRRPSSRTRHPRPASPPTPDTPPQASPGPAPGSPVATSRATVPAGHRDLAAASAATFLIGPEGAAAPSAEAGPAGPHGAAAMSAAASLTWQTAMSAAAGPVEPHSAAATSAAAALVCMNPAGRMQCPPSSEAAAAEGRVTLPLVPAEDGMECTPGGGQDDKDVVVGEEQEEDCEYDVYAPLVEDERDCRWPAGCLESWGLMMEDKSGDVYTNGQGEEAIVHVIQVEEAQQHLLWPEVPGQLDEDHDSDDSNAESYYANSYPDDEDGEGRYADDDSWGEEDDYAKEEGHSSGGDDSDERCAGDDRAWPPGHEPWGAGRGDRARGMGLPCPPWAAVRGGQAAAAAMSVGDEDSGEVSDDSSAAEQAGEGRRWRAEGTGLPRRAATPPPPHPPALNMGGTTAMDSYVIGNSAA